MDFSPSKK